MHFIKGWIRSLAGGAMFFGVLFAGYGLWNIFEERNVSSTPTTLEMAEIKHSGGLVYATVTGGTPDLANTFSHELRRRKRSKGAIATSYYFPVLDGDKVAYIMETKQNPTSINFGSALTNTGLLQDSSRMPQKLQDAYGQAFAGQTYLLLDTSYEHKGIASKLGMAALGLGVAIVGFFIRKLLSRRQLSQHA